MVAKKSICLSEEYIPILVNSLSGFSDLDSIIYIECNNGIIRFNIGSEIGIMDSKFPVKGDLSFACGINSKKFINVSKKFYDTDLHISYTKSHLKMRQDNMEASFIKAESHPIPITYQIDKFVDGNLDILPAMKSCAKTVGNKYLFSGVLLDNTGEKAKACAFSHGAIRVININKLPDKISRISVPVKIIDRIFQMSKYVSRILLSEDKILLFSGDYVIVSLPTSYDSFPHGYQNQVELNKGSSEYTFETSSLAYAVGSASSVCDKEEHFLWFKNIGKSNNNDVWSIEAVSSDNNSVSEKILSTNSVNSEITSFKLGKRYITEVLKTINSDYIKLIDSSNFVCITNEERNDNSYLVKAYG